MSRYPGPDFRGARDRSRSPPRFTDRRASSASIFDPRPPGPPRTASDAPRGPRSQFDGVRPPLSGGPGTASSARPGFNSLRDAPPLGSGDRGRPYREREYDRRDRPASPRERSPSRGFKEPRDYPSRDLDIARTRRESRDGPLSAGSNYSDGQSTTPSSASRGALSRGRGRGDFSLRGGRGGRSNLDDRELFRRERSPPPRWTGESTRDSREPERRDDRRFDRREDDRRPQDWTDRDRDREVDRSRRDQGPPRLDSRPSSESISASSTSHQPPQAPQMNPARLAMIENAASEPSVRRPSMQQDTPSYLNGRAETTANRYGSRGSSPPTQAPPVPAFTLSFAPPAASSAPSSQPAPSAQTSKLQQELKTTAPALNEVPQQPPNITEERKTEPPPEAPIAPRMPPAAPKAQLVSPPHAAPRAPRALESEDFAAASNRLQGVRSLENLAAPGTAPTGPNASRRPPSHSMSPAATHALPSLNQPVSPSASQAARVSELNPPTGPRAARMSPAQASVSPRPPFASPRSDVARTSAMPRMQTPPPTAPSGPRNQSYSVSPKVANSSVPTEPKANRAFPVAPRGPERGQMPTGRANERLGVTPWAPPSAPRGQPIWNQWRRPGAPPYAEKTVPAKRDVLGEEKSKAMEQAPSGTFTDRDAAFSVKSESDFSKRLEGPSLEGRRIGNEVGVERQPPRRQSSMMAGHSAAQSFIGKPAQGEDDDSAISDTAQEPSSTSDDDESDMENNMALFNAKFERQKRQLEAQMVDLSTRHYRATTPLENLARLARISTRDLERFHEQRDNEMEVDRSPVARKHHMIPPTRHSSDSGDGPDIVTPDDEDDRRVAIRSSDDSSDGMRRARRPTPEPVDLPYLLKDAHLSFSESEALRENVQRYERSKADLLDAMEGETQAEEETAAYIEEVFAREYRKWREECEHLDRFKEEQEKLERQQTFEPKPEIDAPSVIPANPIFEGRRLHKFNSEYEFEQVLKQSEETARIEQERQDREARKNQADMEKEAKIPDQLTEEQIARGIFVDSNRYRDPESLTLVFSYQPPPDDFTENEQHIFIAAFKETPKKWGEIASLLPGRSYEDCIRHYYTNKWDGRFRDHRTKKLKSGARRGRGGARGPRGRVGGLMADLARVEDFLSTENMSEKGRPRRAAAPTTFAEKEAEAKASLLGPSPAKKSGPGAKNDSNGDTGPEKSGKRQKRTGEKPGRKSNKSNQPLAALAAAPQDSPGKQYFQGMPSKEDLADANLLASLHGGHQGAPHGDSHMIYHQEGYVHAIPPNSEESERPKAAGQGPATKQGASSYWSVPEQNDFVKYIGHFGRDFAAIANHMGTKTQTMIKNHYQRQVDGGNRPELERAAVEADERRARGEDMGPPPTPTPIQKRKYENPPGPSQRPLAPHAEGVDVDDSGPLQRLQAAKQISPPQYQPQPRFASSTQNPTSSAPRVGPSTLSTSATPSASVPATSHSRPVQHPFGSRITFLPDTRSEVRSTAQPGPGYRANQESPTRSQQPQQSRSVPDAQDPQFIRNLVQEQERALRMQRQQSHQDRVDQIQRQPTMQRNPSQGSPLNQPMHNPPDRKPILEDKPLSPLRGNFASSSISRSLFGSGTFPPISSTSLSPLAGRSAFNMSPQKREDSRPDTFSSAPTGVSSITSATPTEPKRSNVLSLLNSEPEEPKPTKRDSLPPAPPRTASPAQQGFPHTTSATPVSGVPAPRREPSFGQPSVPQSHFHRGSFGQQSSTSTPAAHSHKHEPSPGSGSSQTAKPDWAARVLGQSSQPSPPTPTLDRDGRPYLHHRSILGPLGQSRINPSPPPLTGITHSRTPSLSGQSSQQSREQSRASLSGQQAAQGLQPNSYANQTQPSFTHQQSSQAQNQSHHSHNSSLTGPFPSFHQRSMSREERLEQERARQEQAIAAAQREREREREDQDLRWRQQREAMEHQRRGEEQYIVQRQQEQERERERERQQTLHRGPPPPLQPPPFGNGTYSQGRNLDLRGQSWKDGEMAMREEQERQRQQQDSDRRRQEDLARQREADDRRRQEDGLFFGRSSLGSGFGVPPPGQRR